MKRTKALALLAVTALLAALLTMLGDGVTGTVEPAHALPADTVGASVSTPVTVYDTVDRNSSGELVREGNRVPDIVALDDDNLVVAWRSGVEDPDGLDPTPNDSGDIRYGYSSDGGATWTTGMLAQADSTYRYHYAILLNDGGTLYALLGRVTIDDDRDGNGQLNGFPTYMIAKRSTDNGHTWTDHAVTVNVPANDAGVVIAGRPFEYGGQWLVPFWREQNGVKAGGVLSSNDLVTWNPGGLVVGPSDFQIEEPQVVVSQDDPGTLLMVTRTLDQRGGATAAERNTFYRANASYVATATSTDGGVTWSSPQMHFELPNYYVKAFFTKDSFGRYLHIYNTFAGSITGSISSRPDQYREVLYYQVKRPGEPWSPGRMFADGVRETNIIGRGWDTYASADEYSPGKFVVVWEHQQTSIKVARLDLNPEFTGVDTDWGSLDGWSATGDATVGAGGLHLASSTSSDSGVSQLYGPSSDGFVATLRGRVTDYSALDAGTGVGASLAMKVATGQRRLMLSIQADGVYSHVDGVSGWSRVYAVSNDTSTHTWTVTVDGSGNAVLYRDGTETGASWLIHTNSQSARVGVWTNGSASDPASAVVEHTEVRHNHVSTDWNSAGTFTLDSGADLTGGRLHLRSTTDQVVGASTPLDATRACDVTLEFRGWVDDDSALDPQTGAGVSLGTKVATGAKRLMVTVQLSGVWSMKKGSTEWEKVYTLNPATGPATWKVTVDAASVAKLYRNGVDTGATWVVQDHKAAPKVSHWVSGTAGGNVAEAHVEWSRVTC
jgi:hypothetical protein